MTMYTTNLGLGRGEVGVGIGQRDEAGQDLHGALKQVGGLLNQGAVHPTASASGAAARFGMSH